MVSALIHFLSSDRNRRLFLEHTMAEAGPSVPKKTKKKPTKHAVRSSKVKKVMQVKSIESLEASAMQYVSCAIGLDDLVRTHSLT